MIRVSIERLFPDVPLPTRGTLQSAGYDVVGCFAERPVEVFSSIDCPNEGDVTATSCESNGRTKGKSTQQIGVICLSREQAFEPGLQLHPGARAKLPLGIKLNVPVGYKTELLIRSGHAWLKGLALVNGVGLIDADYPGEVHAVIVNLGSKTIRLRHLERIGQLVFSAHETVNFVEATVHETTNRSGGFNSTGLDIQKP